jgi:hypothetical protein
LEELRLRTIEDRIAADLACWRHIEVNSELEALVTPAPATGDFLVPADARPVPLRDTARVIAIQKAIDSLTMPGT